eukprot:4871623-Prymnesium_polylepis.1
MHPHDARECQAAERNRPRARERVPLQKRVRPPTRQHGAVAGVVADGEVRGVRRDRESCALADSEVRRAGIADQLLLRHRLGRCGRERWCHAHVSGRTRDAAAER